MKHIKINTVAIALLATSLTAFAVEPAPGLTSGQVLNSARVDRLTGANSGINGGADKSREQLRIAVMDGDKPIAAKCVLTNEHGDWSVTTPDTVKVSRSDSDLQVKCSAVGYAPISATLNAATISIPRPHFHFSTDSGGDGDDSASVDDEIKVPAYPATITLNATPINATATTN